MQSIYEMSCCRQVITTSADVDAHTQIFASATRELTG
jgi:hypothetical protein